MNNLLYIDNNPTKPILYVGVIFFSYNNDDKKTQFLLMENNLAKYGDIGISIENYIENNNGDENYNGDDQNDNNNSSDDNVVFALSEENTSEKVFEGSSIIFIIDLE